MKNHINTNRNKFMLYINSRKTRYHTKRRAAMRLKIFTRYSKLKDDHVSVDGIMSYFLFYFSISIKINYW